MEKNRVRKIKIKAQKKSSSTETAFHTLHIQKLNVREIKENTSLKIDRQEKNKEKKCEKSESKGDNISIKPCYDHKTRKYRDKKEEIIFYLK